MQVSLIHMQVSDSMEENLKTAEQMIYDASEAGSKFICLPEYFSIPSSLEDQKSVGRVFNETYERTLLFLKQVSKNVAAYIIGGTLVERFRDKFYNTCLLLKNGKVLGKYRKMHLTLWEKTLNLNRGRTLHVFETEFCKVGILICADIFYPKTVKKLASMGAEVIFLPVSASKTHPPVKGHPLSTARAKDNHVFILKNGNIKSNSRGGSSAIISPWGILNEAKNEKKNTIISANLDLRKLRDYRRSMVTK
ncbi:carbon-nitrogen hydrolase family protein [Candidatus Bathyarchaeota archaeon]|nr:carbon-nitrogen hydrolase family protein [Candidatus Bathyarchaeota archaeon]